jgi:hypothetical protein
MERYQMSAITLRRGDTTAGGTPTVAVLDDLIAELFDLGLRAVPATDMAGSNTTTDCTDNGCSASCPSVGCSTGCGD